MNGFTPFELWFDWKSAHSLSQHKYEHRDSTEFVSYYCIISTWYKTICIAGIIGEQVVGLPNTVRTKRCMSACSVELNGSDIPQTSENRQPCTARACRVKVGLQLGMGPFDVQVYSACFLSYHWLFLSCSSSEPT